jgi:hypothetical protein
MFPPSLEAEYSSSKFYCCYSGGMCLALGLLVLRGLFRALPSKHGTHVLPHAFLFSEVHPFGVFLVPDGISTVYPLLHGGHAPMAE